MQTTYRKIPAADVDAHFLPEDLRGLHALGFREAGAFGLSDPALPASMEGKLFVAPDGSAQVSLHGLSADDPFVEIRTLLQDGTLIQTVRRRRAAEPQPMHLAHGAWPSLSMYVVPGDDRAAIETVWAEHQHAVEDLIAERGSHPGEHADPEFWFMVSPRARLPFNVVRRAYTRMRLALLAWVILFIAPSFALNSFRLFDEPLLPAAMWFVLVGLLPAAVVGICGRRSPRGPGLHGLLVDLQALRPGSPPPTEAELREAFHKGGSSAEHDATLGPPRVDG